MRLPPPTISGLGFGNGAPNPRGAMQGLKFAQPQSQTFQQPFQPTPEPTMFDATSDLGGAALRGRADAATNSYYDPIVNDPNESVLNKGIAASQRAASLVSNRDPQGFGSWLQALNEAAPVGIQTPSRRGNPMPGLPAARLDQPSTYDPSFQSSALEALKRVR